MTSPKHAPTRVRPLGAPPTAHRESTACVKHRSPRPQTSSARRNGPSERPPRRLSPGPTASMSPPSIGKLVAVGMLRNLPWAGQPDVASRTTHGFTLNERLAQLNAVVDPLKAQFATLIRCVSAGSSGAWEVHHGHQGALGGLQPRLPPAC